MSLRSRHLLLTAAIGLLAACSGTGGDSIPSTTAGAGPGSSTTGTVTTSTLAPTTTTVVTTTTTTEGPTANDPYLPASWSRNAVPWDEVGPGWHVVQYDSSKAHPTSAEDVREGPGVTYLVDPDGRLFEMAVWPAGSYAHLVDATPSAALVAHTGTDLDHTVYEHLDLVTGKTSVVYEVGFPESSQTHNWPPVTLTRPTGANVVVHRSDGVIEWLERRSPDGSVLATIFEQPYVEGDRSLGWLYGHRGTSLVVTHRDGIGVVAIDGSPIADLWAPADTVCDPVRWWDADTFLAACYGLGPASAPLDEYGEPHRYYGRLWLIGIDGRAGTPLTEFPDDPPIVVDFGYHDAWPIDEEVLLQWSGDCGASLVATLTGTGHGEFLPMSVPAGLVTDGVAMVSVFGDSMSVHGWEGCAGDVGELFTTSLEGQYQGTLVEAIGDTRGVTGVVGLTEVYP